MIPTSSGGENLSGKPWCQGERVHEPTNHFLWCQWDKLQPKPLNEFGSLSPCQKLQNRHNLIECNPKKKKKKFLNLSFGQGVFPGLCLLAEKAVNLPRTGMRRVALLKTRWGDGWEQPGHSTMAHPIFSHAVIHRTLRRPCLTWCNVHPCHRSHPDNIPDLGY